MYSGVTTFGDAAEDAGRDSINSGTETVGLGERPKWSLSLPGHRKRIPKKTRKIPKQKVWPPKTYTLNPKSKTLNPKPLQTPKGMLRSCNPEPLTLQPSTPNPPTLKPKS